MTHPLSWAGTNSNVWLMLQCSCGIGPSMGFYLKSYLCISFSPALFCFFLTGFPGNTHLINNLHRTVSGDDNQRHHIICQVSLTNKNQSQWPVFLLSVIFWYHGLIWDVLLIRAEKQGSLWLDFLSLERKKVPEKKAYEIVPTSLFFILWWVYSYCLLDRVTCIY